MQSVYYEASKPGLYGGMRPLARYSSSPTKTMMKLFSSQDAYTLRKPIRKTYLICKTFAKGINDLFQADLVEMQSMLHINGGYRYKLTCIDMLLKYAIVIPLKDKKDQPEAPPSKTYLRNVPQSFYKQIAASNS